jgi:hypothetical protein
MKVSEEILAGRILQQEYIASLKKNGIAYDERYMWNSF